MKKTLLSLSLLIASGMAQAYICRVDLVNSQGRLVQTYTAQSEYNGTCRDGLRDCKRDETRMNIPGARCQTRQAGQPAPPPAYGGGYGSGYGGGNGGHNPPNNGGGYGGGYNPPHNGGGYGGGYGQGNIYQLLQLSDLQLAQEAALGIGRCKVNIGTYYNACDYYVQVNGAGWPHGGTGCASSQYTQAYGCSRWSEQENAGCMIRKAIERGLCI